MTSLKIVLIVKLENFRRRATVCATHVLLENNNLVHLAKHALPVNLAAVKQIPRVKIAPKGFTKTSQEHRTACLVCLVNFKFQVVNRLVINVQQTQQVKVPIQPPANHVTLEKIPSPAVRNVSCAVRVRLALGVKIACRVNIVQVAIQMLLCVLIVPLVSVNVTRDKLRVFHAVPVNSTMLQVPSSVNFVLMRRTLVKREEIAVV